jgi:hypothetical protein
MPFMSRRTGDAAMAEVAVVWRSGREARRAATPQSNRFHRVFEELAAIGIQAKPAVFDEEYADEVPDQLLTADGVLVWVDPLHEGKTRAALDTLLRDVAARGPWVSAHPDVILKMGVKDGGRTRTSIAPRKRSRRRFRRGCGQGKIVAALNVCYPSMRITPEDLRTRVLAETLAASNAITRALQI